MAHVRFISNLQLTSSFSKYVHSSVGDNQGIPLVALWRGNKVQANEHLVPAVKSTIWTDSDSQFTIQLCESFITVLLINKLWSPQSFMSNQLYPELLVSNYSADFEIVKETWMTIAPINKYTRCTDSKCECCFCNFIWEFTLSLHLLSSLTP